jgi:hypothetical protein
MVQPGLSLVLGKSLETLAEERKSGYWKPAGDNFVVLLDISAQAKSRETILDRTTPSQYDCS